MKSTFVGAYHMASNENGFTLIELMITLMVLLALVTVLPSLMIASVKSTGADHQNEEAQLFYVFLAREIRGATSLSTNGKNLILMKNNGEMILYEKYNGLIRRRVNGTGHEVMLQGIKTVEVTIAEQRVVVEVELFSGVEMEEVFYQIGQAF